MKLCAIIAEFNPFHNGHKYIIQKAKEITKADKIIILMSGSFVQRGAPAIMDKWTRTKMALLNDADLVIELPVYFSNSSAQDFAYGALNILEKLNVDYLFFGSEIGDINTLNLIAKTINEEDSIYKIHFNKCIKEGESFHKSMLYALNKKLNTNFILKSNDLLAITYIRTILKYNYKIKPFTITRINNNYYDENLNKNISSATAIRNILQKRSINYDILKTTIPENTFNLYYEYPKFIDIEDFHQIFNSIFIREYPQNIKKIRLISEGIENFINNNLSLTNNLNHIINSLVTKRYSKNRISRLFIDIILGIEKISEIDIEKNLDYVRILGMKNTDFIKEIKKNTNMYFLQNYGKDLKKYQKSNKIIDMDIKSTKIYSQINYKYNIRQDYEQIPIIL